MIPSICRKLLALLLCAVLLCPLTAFAEGEDGDVGILDADALTQIVESYCANRGLDKENFSVGYCYTATGDTWYYNPDVWYYSASMYKVPVMMILAERYRAGEITDETKISGLTLAEANELILVYSHNDYAHAMMHYIGTDAECRTLYQQYAELPEDYYVSDFYDYSYFTARFMTQVMKTLYYESERFPNVIEHLLLAQPGQYFKAGITDVQIAQKYGNFQDSMGRQFTHDTGIVYTENPFILTVMTKNMGAQDTVIAGICGAFEDYTRSVDGNLPAYLAAQEEARLKAEEEARLQAEAEAAKAQAEQEAAAGQAAAAEEPLSAAEETAPPQQPAVIRPHGVNRVVMIGFAVLIGLLLAAFLAEYTVDRRQRKAAAAARARMRHKARVKK